MINRYRKATAFWRKYGTRALLARIRGEFARKVEQTSVPFILPGPVAKSVAQLSKARFAALAPLSTYLLPGPPRRRVNMVTDSIGRESLFGGVGTALIFCTLLANKLGADLRIITRTERSPPDNVEHILSVYGLALQGEIQFKFLPPEATKESVDFSATELFVTTSWWTTAATLPSVPTRSIVYLLQEDERMFYPFGDDRLRCEQVLRRSDIRFVINTRLLFEHFVAEGFSNIQQAGSWFEPSFPARVFYPRPQQAGNKRKFIFYARPHNQRNLFFLGIEVIEAAIAQQVLDLAQWEIILAGKDIPPDLVFEGGHVPARHENMNWSDYANLVGTIDLGLSLMYTPHPSYPPLDLVASGAVVVTNRFANKQDLGPYSANLICVEPEKAALVEAIRQGVVMATNPTVRTQNFQANRLGTDWNQSFADILGRIGGSD